MMDKKAEREFRKAVKEQQKRIKPGECEKYIRLVIDGCLLTSDLGQELAAELLMLQLQFEVRDLAEQKCIIWERDVEDQSGGGDKWQIEDQVFRLVDQTEFHSALKADSLNLLTARVKRAFPGLKPTMLLPRDRKSKTSKASLALISLQMEEEVAVVQVDPSAKEIATALKRYTKAVAEGPFKKQKTQSLGSFKKFVANDKKQCVRVEGTRGLNRLWQQHLTRLPMVTLDVAESIIAQYPCPKKLIDEFASNPEAVNELADLKIQRGPARGAIQKDRRIGNVLSGKLNTLYTTTDPNTLL